jgi:hypothetical protein
MLVWLKIEKIYMKELQKFQNSCVRVGYSGYNSSRFSRFSFSLVFKEFSLVCLEVGFLGLFGGCVCGLGLTAERVQGVKA